MRYLQRRNEFLIDKNIKTLENININEEIKTSAIINETFENDITWGGSMIGRLINSTIRRVKIGYSQTKIDPLVTKLEDELNYLLKSSIQGETLRKFNELVIKQFMEEMRDICLSNRTDPEKLKLLLGQDTGLYDPNDPKKNQRTIGVLQEALDIITDDLEDLEKIFGEERNKLIDKLSDFSDDLRKLTVPAGTPVQPTQQSAVSDFSLNFLHTLDKLKKSGLITASFNVSTFSDFVYEAESTTIQKQEAKTNQNQVKIDQKYNQLLSDWKKNQQAAGQNTNPGEGTRKRLMREAEASLSGNTQNITTKDIKTSTTPQVTKKEIDEVINILKNQKDQEKVKEEPKVKDLLNKISQLPKDKVSKINLEFDGEDLSFVDGINKLKTDIVKESIYTILEANGGLNTQPGTTGSTSGSGGTSPSNTEDQTVKGTWDLYEWDKNREMTRLTQREVDELKNLFTKGTDKMRYDPEKRPDPIVSIARIFGEAHQLYFTDVIPSGRPNGRVSQKTFREYYKLGKVAAKWEQGVAPEGPFAVKSIFNKWKTGVEKLMMNQEYRKVFANVKFVVPGAADKFNDNFDTSIFEADGDDAAKIARDASQGQILFDFMNSMLDKNKLDDFDTLRSNLMSKYFGISLSDKQKQPESNQPNREPTKADFEANVAYFTSLQDPTLNTNVKFYAIPIKKREIGKAGSGKYADMIFLQVIKKITVTNSGDAILVKFSYEHPFIMKAYYDKFLKGKKYVDWASPKTPTLFLYYGLMSSKASNLKLSNGKDFTIVYGNVNQNSIRDVYTTDFKVQEGEREIVGGKVQVKASKFVFNDDVKVNDISLPQGFEAKLMASDSAKHDENLAKMVGGKKLIEELKEKFKAIP